MSPSEGVTWVWTHPRRSINPRLQLPSRTVFWVGVTCLPCPQPQHLDGSKPALSVDPPVDLPVVGIISEAREEGRLRIGGIIRRRIL